MEIKMASIVGARPDIYQALAIANHSLASRDIEVSCASEELNPKEPVYLQIRSTVTGETRNIGITHLVHLKGQDWDSQPFERIARTTGEVATAIIDRISLFNFAEAQKLYIDEAGTIFDFGTASVELFEDGTFTVNEKMVTFAGQAISLSNFKSEGIITFRTLPNGHIHLSDDSDHREGKGMFLNTEGQFYRA